MTTTPYEDAIADSVTEVNTLLGDSWPIVIAGTIGLIAFRLFRRFTRSAV